MESSGNAGNAGSSGRRRKRARGTLTAGLLALAAVSGCAAEPASRSAAATSPPAATAPPALSAPSRAGLPKSEPESVDVPKIGAFSTLIPLGLNADGTVQVPPVNEPRQAGWYELGPTPGEIGPAVILGHVDGNKQEGIFWRLKELAPGDQVSVARRDGATAHFVVTRVDQIDKDEFPTEAVYGDTTDAELRLITCGGSFDHAAHSYRDNIIVYAVLQ